MTDRDSRIETEGFCQKKMSTEIKYNPEVNLSSNFKVKNETTDSTDISIHEMYTKIEVKQEPCFLETSSAEVKPELDVKVNSWFDYKTLGDDCKTDSKIEIKEESLWSTEEGSEFQRIQSEDAEDSATKGDQFILPELTRSKAETMPNYEFAVTSADLGSSCLKLSENSRPSEEKININATQGGEIPGVVHVDNKMSKKSKINDKCFSLASELKTQIVTRIKSRWRCEICEKIFTRPSHLREHYFIHEGIRPFKCDKCQKSFTKASSLKAHNLIHQGIRSHKCEICEKSFTKASNLKVHNLIHQGIKSHQCGICEKRFICASDLKRHSLIHGDKKPFKCDKCDKSYTTASNLVQHNVIHEGKRPFKCNVCDKSFTTAHGLRTHFIIHDGKSPFKCLKCNKIFTKISHLKMHDLIHEGRKPHKCDICEKSFTQMSHLKAHKFIHSGVSPFNCQVCYKGFSSASHLRAHSLIHEGKRSHKCQICEKSFINVSHLKRHNLIHEG